MKTIKTFSFAFVIVCSLVVLILWIPALIGMAQTTPEPPTVRACDAVCQAQMITIYQEAQQLQMQEQYELAAQRYMAVLDGDPLSDNAQRAAFRAANCYWALNKLPEALAAYDQVIAVTDTKLPTVKRSKGKLRSFLISYWERALINKAEIYEQQGQYQQAADHYGRIVSRITQRKGYLIGIKNDEVAITLESAGRAAESLAKINKYAEAIAYCNVIIDIGDARGNNDNLELEGESNISYHAYIAKGLALIDKARLCAQAGMVNEALGTIQQFKSYYGDLPGVCDIQVLEAQLTGGDVGRAEWLSVQENQASEILKVADRADRVDHNKQLALEMLDKVITDYPETSAATRAMLAKGILLDEADRFEEGREVLLAVLQRLGTTASLSRTYQDARYSLARLQIRYLTKKQEKKTLQSADLEALRSLCTEIANTDLRMFKRDVAKLIHAETYSLENKLDLTIKEAEEFLKEKGDTGDRFNIGTSMHAVAGSAAYVAGLYDKAMSHFDWVIANKDKISETSRVLPYTYYRIWQVKRASGAMEAEVAGAAETLQQLYPDSVYTQIMQKQ